MKSLIRFLFLLVTAWSLQTVPASAQTTWPFPTLLYPGKTVRMYASNAPSVAGVKIDGIAVPFNLGQATYYSAAYLEFPIPLPFQDGNSHTIYAVDANGLTLSVPQPKTFVMATPTYAHVQQFGYWYSTFKTDIGGLRVNSPDTTQVSNHAKTAVVFGFLASGADPWHETRELLDDAKANGLKAIVAIPAWGSYGDGQQSNCPLPTDWQSRLSGWAASIASYVADGTIAAFLTIDEPQGDCIQRAQDVTTYVKPFFPSIPHWTNMGSSEIYGSWPNNSDWISFDLYGSPFLTVSNTFDSVKARLQPGQRIVLISEAADFSNGAYGNFDNYLAITANQYINLAQDPAVVALIPFMWEHSGLIGVRDLPTTKAKYTEFGIQYFGH